MRSGASDRPKFARFAGRNPPTEKVPKLGRGAPRLYACGAASGILCWIHGGLVRPREACAGSLNPPSPHLREGFIAAYPHRETRGSSCFYVDRRPGVTAHHPVGGRVTHEDEYEDEEDFPGAGRRQLGKLRRTALRWCIWQITLINVLDHPGSWRDGTKNVPTSRRRPKSDF